MYKINAYLLGIRYRRKIERTCKIAAPATAPILCTTMKNKALRSLMSPVAKNPAVTAGLMWQPLTWPID